MDCAQAAEVAGVQGLQQIEGFWPPDLAKQDAVRTMSQRGAEEIRD